VEIVRVSSGATEDAASASDDVITRIRTDKVGSTGNPIGLDEAKRQASNEIRRLKRRGIEAKINVREVPRVHLYSIASDGRVESRDAETGEIVWNVRVGDRRLPYQGLGVSENFVTVINGANLIQLDAENGETIVELRTMKTPIFGATNSGRFAMIPSIGGGIQGYPLYDPTLDPFLEIVEGSALHLPTKAPGSTKVGWGTDRGFVYVMELQGTPSVLFRLNTDGIVSGKVASASGDRFFFASENGQVYGIRATRSGKVLWSQPYGEPFYNEPFVFGEKILLRSAYGNLFALDAYG
jgi:outer membrane protein assembly factor BamB